MARKRKKHDILTRSQRTTIRAKFTVLKLPAEMIDRMLNVNDEIDGGELARRLISECRGLPKA